MSLFHLRSTPEGCETLSELLACKYVRRGMKWLNHNAPKGWFRNCLTGNASRIHIGSPAAEGIIAIAFEYCSQFADNSGYINEGKVLRHFNLWPSSIPVYRLGFSSRIDGYQPFTRYPSVRIIVPMLDVAWAAFLKERVESARLPYQHATPLDREFANSPPIAELRSKASPLAFFGRLLGHQSNAA